MLLIDDYLLYKLLIEPPVTLGWLVCESIRDMCNRELTDEGAVHEKILELQLRYELDEMPKEEYQKEEAKLMARLRKIREAKQKEIWGEDTSEYEGTAKEDKGKPYINNKEIRKEANPENKPGDEGGNNKKEYI